MPRSVEINHRPPILPLGALPKRPNSVATQSQLPSAAHLPIISTPARPAIRSVSVASLLPAVRAGQNDLGAVSRRPEFTPRTTLARKLAFGAAAAAATLLIPSIVMAGPLIGTATSTLVLGGLIIAAGLVTAAGLYYRYMYTFDKSMKERNGNPGDPTLRQQLKTYAIFPATMMGAAGLVYFASLALPVAGSTLLLLVGGLGVLGGAIGSIRSLRAALIANRQTATPGFRSRLRDIIGTSFGTHLVQGAEVAYMAYRYGTMAALFAGVGGHILYSLFTGAVAASALGLGAAGGLLVVGALTAHYMTLVSRKRNPFGHEQGPLFNLSTSRGRKAVLVTAICASTFGALVGGFGLGIFVNLALGFMFLTLESHAFQHNWSCQTGARDIIEEAPEEFSDREVKNAARRPGSPWITEIKPGFDPVYFATPTYATLFTRKGCNWDFIIISALNINDKKDCSNYIATHEMMAQLRQVEDEIRVIVDNYAARMGGRTINERYELLAQMYEDLADHWAVAANGRPGVADLDQNSRGEVELKNFNDPKGIKCRDPQATMDALGRAGFLTVGGRITGRLDLKMRRFGRLPKSFVVPGLDEVETKKAYFVLCQAARANEFDKYLGRIIAYEGNKFSALADELRGRADKTGAEVAEHIEVLRRQYAPTLHWFPPKMFRNFCPDQVKSKIREIDIFNHLTKEYKTGAAILRKNRHTGEYYYEIIPCQRIRALDRQTNTLGWVDRPDAEMQGIETYSDILYVDTRRMSDPAGPQHSRQAYTYGDMRPGDSQTIHYRDGTCQIFSVDGAGGLQITWTDSQGQVIAARAGDEVVGVPGWTNLPADLPQGWKNEDGSLHDVFQPALFHFFGSSYQTMLDGEHADMTISDFLAPLLRDVKKAFVLALYKVKEKVTLPYDPTMKEKSTDRLVRISPSYANFILRVTEKVSGQALYLPYNWVKNMRIPAAVWINTESIELMTRDAYRARFPAASDDDNHGNLHPNIIVAFDRDKTRPLGVLPYSNLLREPAEYTAAEFDRGLGRIGDQILACYTFERVGEEHNGKPSRYLRWLPKEYDWPEMDFSEKFESFEFDGPGGTP